MPSAGKSPGLRRIVAVLAALVSAAVLTAALGVTAPAAKHKLPRVEPGKTVTLTARGGKTIDVLLVPASARQAGCELLTCDGALLHGLAVKGKRHRVKFAWPAFLGHCTAGCGSLETAEHELAQWQEKEKVIVYFLRSGETPSSKVAGHSKVVVGSAALPPEIGTQPPPPLPPPTEGGEAVPASVRHLMRAMPSSEELAVGTAAVAGVIARAISG
jgi:hypothetical protein